MAKKAESRVYAVARATLSNGYGHLEVNVWEMFGYNSQASLRLRCQTGGTTGSMRTQSYAWYCGMANNSGVISLPEMEVGIKILRRAKKIEERENETRGEPLDFADFVVRQLQAVGVRKLHIIPGINAGYSGGIENQPTFDPLTDDGPMLEMLRGMEQSLIQRTGGLYA